MTFPSSKPRRSRSWQFISVLVVNSDLSRAQKLSGTFSRITTANHSRRTDVRPHQDPRGLRLGPVDPEADSIGSTEQIPAIREHRAERRPAGRRRCLDRRLWRAARGSYRCPFRLRARRSGRRRILVVLRGTRDPRLWCPTPRGTWRSRRWSPSSPVGRRFLPRGATSHRIPSPTLSRLAEPQSMRRSSSPKASCPFSNHQRSGPCSPTS